jgi:hypothetical protein
MSFHKKQVALHFISWMLLYGAWVFIFQNHSFAITRTMTIEFCYLFFIVLDYYLIIYLLLPKILYKKGISLFAIVDLSLIVASAALRTLLALYMSAHFFSPGKPQPGFYFIFQNSLLNIFIWVQVLTAIKMIWDKLKTERYISFVEHERTVNELNFLKAQVNPHFLFNSLNSVYGHIDKTNSTARSILLKFSELLRYQLYECSLEKTSLKNEIGYIRNYVSLEQYRKEEDLIVTLNIDENLEELEIAPLILVVFIENAFKHVSTGCDLNNIRIDLTRTGESLDLAVYNTIEHEQLVAGTNEGIGLANVHRRLNLLYPDKHSLQVSKSASSYIVNLKLDLS